MVLPWPLALAVQMGLFGLAWLIAVGQVKLRALVIALYCLTMPFSVVFSYVMLQSEFTAEIRPQEAQRGLFDDLRQRSAAVASEIDKSLSESDELQLRLASWLEMEKAGGWTIRRPAPRTATATSPASANGCSAGSRTGKRGSSAPTGRAPDRL